MDTFKALVVVIRGADADEAWQQVSDALRSLDDVQMVGTPWTVVPTADGETFDTLSCFDQHPEK